MKRKPIHLRRGDWAPTELVWRGRVEGTLLGTGATILFYTTDKVGDGPRWHAHPYDEIFIVREGRALFMVGDQRIEADAGDILLGPANVPHKFCNLGPGRLETTDIHMSARFIQTNLEDRSAEATPQA